MAPVLDEVFQRFAEQSPITVMARAALEHALAPRALDELFERVSERQYTRTLLFSSVVDLMATVVTKIRPAVNAAYRARAETLGVWLRAVSDKLLLVTLFGEACDSRRVTPRSAGSGATRDDTASR